MIPNPDELSGSMVMPMPEAAARHSVRAFAAFMLALILLPLSGAPASAQPSGCVLSRPQGGPERQVLRCGAGLTIEAERSARYEVIDQNRDGEVDAARLSGGALLIEFQRSGRRRSFQILTPHATASVRGTTWVVDVQSARSSVFVVDGRVGVARSGQRASVTLGGGEGVDVEPGTRPLRVTRWSAQRVSALLARFGR